MIVRRSFRQTSAILVLTHIIWMGFGAAIAQVGDSLAACKGEAVRFYINEEKTKYIMVITETMPHNLIVSEITKGSYFKVYYFGHAYWIKSADCFLSGQRNIRPEHGEKGKVDGVIRGFGK